MELNGKVYLDYSASTPLDPIVLEKMNPFLAAEFGNPSSVHWYGQRAEAAVDEARDTIASILNCTAQEIIFTSGGTESDNLALRGTAIKARKIRSANHLLISPVEHHAVTRTAKQLADWFGFELEYLPVDQYGRVDPEDVRSRLRPTTAVVSIIYANNEIGTVNPVGQIGKICQQQEIPFHSDAVQAGASLSLDVQELNVDMLSLGAHKFYGPKGVGVLYKRSGHELLATQTGGGQEHSMRAGTHNVAYIVGMADALQLAQSEQIANSSVLRDFREYLEGFILEEIAGSHLTGHPVDRLPNHSSFVFENVDGNQLLMLLDMAGFSCSSGSACKTGNPEPSDVLLALGLPADLALGSLRITTGRWTTAEHIERFSARLPSIIARSRAMNQAE
jgi:cysteine desulfurase